MGVRDRLAALRKVFGPAEPPSVAAAEADAGMTPGRPFSPGEPIGPYDGYSRNPRSRDFVTGYNISARPRSHERVAFDTLKGLVDAYDVAQMCIWHRIDSIRAMDWSLVAARGYHGDADAAIAAGMAVLEKPDRQTPFANWLAKWLYDVLAYDAGTLYRMRNRRGDAIGLRVVDGTSIAPLLDYWGNSPEPPAEAYVQYVQGLPFNWLTRADLVYEPFRPVTNSPYGRAPLESILLNANTDLRFQAYFLQRFTEGNIPEAFASAPETWTPTQIEQFQEYWDAFMLGDQAMKNQIRWIPGGSTIERSNEKDFSDQFSLFLMRKSCAAYHVVPADLGFTENVNRSSGETQADVQHRVGDLPLLSHVEGILTGFLRHDLGLPVEFSFDTGQEKEDRLALAQAWQIYIESGMASADEGREQLLGLPGDPHRPTPRFYNTGTGPLPLAAIDGLAGKVDPETFGPAPDQPNIAPPSPAAPGPVAKDALALTDTTTTETGIVGYDLVGHSPDEDEDEEYERQELVKRELTAFRRFRQARRRAGTWRDFEFRHVDQVEAHRLNDGGRLAVRKAAGKVAVAGLAVRAADTGRVLMLQRALCDDDPAAGCWECPSGHLEGDETPLQGAWREWAEETGCIPPPGQQTGTWTSPDGVYQGIVWTVDSESCVPVNGSRDTVTNPDDPDGDAVEAVAWWDPAQLPGNPAVRPELLDSIDAVLAALGCEPVAKADAGQRAQAIAPAQQRVVDGLARLADTLTDGGASTGPFVDDAVGVLRDGIREGLTLGTQDADTAAVAKTSAEFEEWRKAFDARFAQYATVVQTAYEEGRSLATLSTGDGWLIRWDAKPGACDLCSARDGNLYEPGDLPGLPGMGGFGDLATVCRGGPRCRCGITYLSQGGAAQPGSAGQRGPIPTPSTGQSGVAAFQQRLTADIVAARQVRQAGHRDPTSGPYADLLDRIADQRAEQQRPYLQGLLRDLRQAAGGGVATLGGVAAGTAVAGATVTVLGDEDQPAPADVQKVDEGVAGDAEARHLHEYWTRGEGLGKWVDAPHPWRTLRAHLAQFIHDPEELDRTTSQWFHDATGMWSGERKGKNPVGPG